MALEGVNRNIPAKIGFTVLGLIGIAVAVGIICAVNLNVDASNFHSWTDKVYHAMPLIELGAFGLMTVATIIYALYQRIKNKENALIGPTLVTLLALVVIFVISLWTSHWQLSQPLSLEETVAMVVGGGAAGAAIGFGLAIWGRWLVSEEVEQFEPPSVISRQGDRETTAIRGKYPVESTPPIPTTPKSSVTHN